MCAQTRQMLTVDSNCNWPKFDVYNFCFILDKFPCLEIMTCPNCVLKLDHENLSMLYLNSLVSMSWIDTLSKWWLENNFILLNLTWSSQSHDLTTSHSYRLAFIVDLELWPPVFLPSANPYLSWFSSHMSLWSSITFQFAVLLNFLVAFFYPFNEVKKGKISP